MLGNSKDNYYYYRNKVQRKKYLRSIHKLELDHSSTNVKSINFHNIGDKYFYIFVVEKNQGHTPKQL